MKKHLNKRNLINLAGFITLLLFFENEYELFSNFTTEKGFSAMVVVIGFTTNDTFEWSKIINFLKTKGGN